MTTMYVYEFTTVLSTSDDTAHTFVDRHHTRWVLAPDLLSALTIFRATIPKSLARKTYKPGEGWAHTDQHSDVTSYRITVVRTVCEGVHEIATNSTEPTR